MAAERRFKAMGTDAHVIVVGDSALLDHAQRRIEDLEAKWSRFRPTSELSRLNNAHGAPALVSPETFDVVTRAVDAWFLTAGRYDPTILPALVSAGYDRSFNDLPRSPTPPGPNAAPSGPAPGCAEIRLIGGGSDTCLVCLPPGVQLDLGGIGKGYAADLVVNELLDGGADGACVSLGGDVRCAGDAPWPDGWEVDVADPFDEALTALTIGVADGAVVTTTRLKRRWTSADGTQHHHIIDPATGRPARTGLAAVTVVAAEAWWAEVLAKAAFLAGRTDGARLLAGLGVTGVFFDDERRAHRVEQLEAFTR